jgi:catechol 2,3-dioxygenase-like lactoylglutathione lyase family enzyme
MEISNALASLAVADLATSSDWYERLLGPGRRPMSEVVEWQFPGGGGLQVYTAPERSGQGSCTIIVDDIDEIARHLRSLDVAADAEPVRNDRVDTLMINDPDGNSIAFSAPKTDALVR